MANPHLSSFLLTLSLVSQRKTSLRKLSSYTKTRKSTLFVTPRFHAFNPEAFKKFGVTVNTALEKLTEGKITVEVFHPEYVFRKKGGDNEMRRSPHPALVICLRD